jgi:Zn-dependent peptidase ImmA (M78 family)
MPLPKQKIITRPESEDKLSDMVRKLLREADAMGVLPTPIERLFEIARVTNVDRLPDESFLANLSAQTKGLFKGAWQKLRGIADLREKVTYVPKDNHTGRELFVKAHELGHQTIPWHKIDPAYLDDVETLSLDAKAIFEREANFFGAETMFQVDRFRMMARDYQPSFDAIFTLADRHGASKQATAWRFVEEQDEPLALMQYYPGSAIDEHGNPVFYLWRSVGSAKFNEQITGVDIPLILRTGHSWLSARDTNRACNGNENLIMDGYPVNFQWHAWWNGYTLLVLLRRRPLLHVVGSLLRNN